ncbi:MAG: hypothetical protein IR164_15380 [Devosia sp.]|uniref:hypothetical protein n=1 Tax=unclassified Devosia TaxID=196773 RepID=UPI0019DDFAE9|nr:MULTISPECIES: hypothetical protein [unclassified Devosia]MBF0680307.1 hypothetical protein [Devosia sp.]WEJ35035.1 hypothetical protein NYQ88_09630 [Devosia sp. SD17-2]
MTSAFRVSGLKTPIIALALGVIPFFLFVGSSQTVTINGAVVRDEQFNFVGAILALVGLGLAARTLLSRGHKALVSKGVAGLAALVCLLQLAASLDLVRPAAWFNPDPDLPPLTYSGLSEANRNLVANIVERGDVEGVARDLRARGRSTLDLAHRHMAYADVCHDGRYRVDYDDIKQLFAVLPQEQQAEILANAEQVRRPNPAPEDCSARMTSFSMGEMVDDIHQQMDMMTILRDGYLELTR